MSKLLSLDRGNYLGKVVDICYADGIIAGVTTYPRGALTSQMHYHDNLHISFVLQGGSLENRIDGKYERLPGNIMFYHAGEAHQNIQKIFPSKNVNLEIEDRLLKKYELTEELIDNTTTHHPDGKFLMLKIYKELLENDSFSPTSISMLFLDLISRFEKIDYKKKVPSWLNKINELLNDSWDEKLSLIDLANTAGVNPITISKHFHKYFSCTLGEYLRKLKIEKSLSIIPAQEISLTEIAYICNFSDQSHFTRTFKQLTGFLPKQYKKLKDNH
jgi:AraC family transcriptional regulator